MINKLKNLLINSSNYFLTNLLAALSGFILLPIITSSISVEEYGMLGLYVSFGSIVNVLFRLGLPGSITRLYYDHGESKGLNNLLTSIVKFLSYYNLILIVILILFFYFFGPSLLKFKLEFLIFVILGSALEAHIDIQRRLIQPREDTKYYLKFNFYYITLYFISVLFFLKVINLRYESIIYSSFITSLVFFLVSRFYLKKNLHGHFDKELLFKSFKYGIGIFPSHLVNPLGTFVFRALILNFAGLIEAGLFTMFQVLNNFLSQIANSFGRAYQPMYNSIKSNINLDLEYKNNQIENISKLLISISTFLTFFSALLSEFIVNILTSNKYLIVAEFSFLICLNFLVQLLYLIFSQEIGFTKKTKFYSYFAFLNQFLSIMLFVFLFKNLNSLGGYLSIFIANFLGLFYIIYISCIKLNLKISIKKIYFEIGYLFFTLILIIYIKLFTNNYLIISFFYITIYFFLFFYFILNRNKILLNEIKKKYIKTYEK